MEQIREAILSGDRTVETYAGIGVPESYRAATVHKDEVEMFSGMATRDKDPRRSLHVEQVPVPELAPGEALVAVMARLRDECPWDRSQTHRSLVTYLVEETGEVVDAIEAGTDDDLVEELGDLLLQVVFHARIAEEEGVFNIDEVYTAMKGLEKEYGMSLFTTPEKTFEGRSIIGGVANKAEKIKKDKQYIYFTSGMSSLKITFEG